MQYTNYAMKNNVFGTLSAPISSLATSIQLATGQGQRFTVDMLATLESMEGNKVTKREIVKITNVAGDTLTVIRKFAPCPSSDDANTQGQVSYSFGADDTISVYISKEHFDKIDDSLNDLYNNGVNKLRTEVVSGLQIKVNPGTVLVGSAYYEFAGDTITLTNNATNYVEIDEDGDLVANTSAWGAKNTKIAKVTTSSGAVTSIEDRRLGTVGGEIGGVNIHDLTEKDTLSPEDEFIVSDSENVRNNKKVKFSNIIGYKKGICAENISKGDVVSVFDQTFIPTRTVDIGNINSKIGVEIFGSGISGDSLYMYLGKVGSGQNIDIRIETDNGGPSGNLVNNNAVATINVADLTTTAESVKIQLNGDIVLDKNQKYWAVLSCNNNDSSNYCIVGVENDLAITNIKIYDGSIRNDPNNTEISTCSISGGSGSGLAYGFTLYMTPNTDFVLKSLAGYGAGTVNISGGDISVSGVDISDINIGLKAGVQYTLNFPINQSYVNYSSGVSTNSIYYTMSGGRANSGTMTVNIELNTVDRCAISSDIIVLDYLQKVNTNRLPTFTNTIGVAINGGTKGTVLDIGIDGAIVNNSTRNLTPGKNYFFINNQITDIANFNSSKICLGKAITEHSIKIDINLSYNISSSVTIICPFDGYFLSANSGGTTITIDGTIYNIVGGLVNKGQKLIVSSTYPINLTKNR